MKSREHVGQMREKLVFCFWKKLKDSNVDSTPHLKGAEAGQLSESSQHEEDSKAETNDTSSNANNTPKSKQLKQIPKDDTAVAPITNSGPLVFPPPGIIYRYFVGKGNNSIMVRSLFKNRFWWVQHDKEDIMGCNFCWT